MIVAQLMPCGLGTRKPPSATSGACASTTSRGRRGPRLVGAQRVRDLDDVRGRRRRRRGRARRSSRCGRGSFDSSPEIFVTSSSLSSRRARRATCRTCSRSIMGLGESRRAGGAGAARAACTRSRARRCARRLIAQPAADGEDERGEQAEPGAVAQHDERRWGPAGRRARAARAATTASVPSGRGQHRRRRRLGHGPAGGVGDRQPGGAARSRRARATMTSQHASVPSRAPPSAVARRRSPRRRRAVEPNHGRNSVTQQRRRARRPRSTRPRRSRLTRTAIRAACSVLRSSMAIVIGPDAAGDRRDRAGDLGRRVEVDVAVEAVVGAVDADVDDRRARLDPVALDHPGAPDRGDQHVGAAADRRPGRACASGSRHGGVGAEQQLGHRLAEEVRAPDDDRLGALELRRRPRRAAASRPSACTAAGPRGPSASSPALIGVRPSTSLPGSIEAGQLDAVEVVGHRQLAEDPADRRVGVELLR